MLLAPVVMWSGAVFGGTAEASGAMELDVPASAQGPCGWAGDNLLGGADGVAWALESYYPSWSQQHPAVCAAGEFQVVGGLTVNHIGVWDGSAWGAISGPSGVGTDGGVSVVREADDSMYAGGNSSSAGGITVNHVARWDGSRWSVLEGPYGTGTNGWVLALE